MNNNTPSHEHNKTAIMEVELHALKKAISRASELRDELEPLESTILMLIDSLVKKGKAVDEIVLM